MTKEEAAANIKEAIALYTEVLEEQGQDVPGDPLEAVLIAV
jgi:predicted RNase H-like HicB family nuclease